MADEERVWTGVAPTVSAVGINEPVTTVGFNLVGALVSWGREVRDRPE